MAHVRHHQGWRLPGRPGRGRGARPRGHRDGDRARAHGPAVQPHARRQDRPAPVRRPHPQLRRGPGHAGLLRRRPDRPHDPADPLPAVHQARRQVLRRVPRRGPASPRAASWATAAGRPASSPTGSPTASSHAPRRRPCCSRPAGSGGCSGSPRTPGASPATASSLAYRHGIPMQDMEFYQFHPTGIVGIGILLSEAARGEGGILLNGDGERFMERYAPKLMDLAPRDMVSRAIYQEIRAGRGIDGKDYVYLDLRHLGRKVIDEKLPDITDFVRVYQGIEPLTDPIPIQPTAHYAMGGIPTDLSTQVDPRRGQDRRARACTPPARRPASASTARTGWDELARGPAGLRPPGRAPDGRGLKGGGLADAVDDAEEPVRAEIEALRAAPSGERKAAHPHGAGRRDDGRRGCLPGRAAGSSGARRKVARAPGPLRERRDRRQGHGLQHGPARGARAGLPARLRRDHRRGALTRKESRGAHAARTSRTATT